jgi:NADH-quinone oxidoreductase subunit L
MAYLTVLNLLMAAALVPLAGGLILRGWGRRMGRRGRTAGTVAMVIAVASFGLALAALLRWGDQGGYTQPRYAEIFSARWVSISTRAEIAGPATMEAAGPGAAAASAATGVGEIRPATEGLTVGCMVDTLTLASFFVVTLVNVLVHLFAVGSVSALIDRSRFYAWMAWLNFSLLGLLLANTLVQTLAFWELTAIAAFFLIRHSMPEEIAPRASLRMYAMNIVGTAAFVLGLGILAMHSQTLAGLAFIDDQGNSLLADTVRKAMNATSMEFLALPGGAGWLGLNWLTWAGMCFVVAVLARMAQFPFFTWLHEVSEAPAAAVALVTMAATAAGVFLLARLYPILTLDTRLIMTVLGGVTLAAGAGAALVQTDLRKILAWLTVSQGGYILLFLGAGGYEAGILHLFTQGFVRTALFLAAGTVLAGLGTADIRQMGGLWKRFPITAFASLAAVMALGGAPWLSGAYSTNLGLACVYDYVHALQAAHGRHFQHLLFYLPAVFTYVTALAIGRWWWLAFAGVNRMPALTEKAHEPAFLTLPVILLTVFCAGRLYDFAGILPLIGKSVPDVLKAQEHLLLVWTGSQEARQVALRFTGLAFLGLGAAAFVYLNGMRFSARLRRLPILGGMEFWLRERFFFDEFFEGVLVPSLALAVRLVGLIERVLGMGSRMAGRVLRFLIQAAIRLDREAAPGVGITPGSAIRGPDGGGDGSNAKEA